MTRETSPFDYSAPAELYTGKRSRRLGKIRYQRFESAARALQFAIEAMPRDTLAFAVLETAEQRFGPEEITALYEHPAYPLTTPEAARGPCTRPSGRVVPFSVCVVPAGGSSSTEYVELAPAPGIQSGAHLSPAPGTSPAWSGASEDTQCH